MNLSKLSFNIKKYGFIILGIVILIFFIVILFNTKKQNVIFQKGKVYQEIGPFSGTYSPATYTKEQFSSTTFYFSVLNNGSVQYFKNNGDSFSGYSMENAIKYKVYKDNPIYLGYFLSFKIANVPLITNSNENYSTFVMNYIYTLPKFLKTGNVLQYIKSDMKNIYSLSSSLKSIKILKYIKQQEYDVVYTYIGYPEDGQGGESGIKSNINIDILYKSGKWEINSIKIY